MIIGPATASDIQTIVEHMGRTFAVDPSIGWVLRKADDPVGVATAYYRATIDKILKVGYIDVAREGDTYLGSAVWLPPGAPSTAPSVRQTIAVLRRVGAAGPALVRCAVASSRVKLPFPAWYLSVIAVDEDARGKGVGTALLDVGLERCAGEAAKLEATSERAAKLYESRGFIRLGEITTSAPTPEIVMWRPAQDRT